MKLFARYNRINLLFTVVIFIIGSIAFSLLIHFVVNNQIDDDLMTEKEEIEAHVSQYGSLPLIENVHDQYTSYKVIHYASSKTPRFYTHELWNKTDHENESVRSVEWTVHVGENWYLVTVSESLDVLEDLIQSIILITIVLISLILIAGLLINRVVLRRLWQPFYNSVQTVQQFHLHDANQIIFENSNIDEFNLLNTTLKNALNKAQNDYHTLKEFTENASHELQTPLAVIGSKLDVIIQGEDLTESQSEAITGAYDALQSLKKLNQALLLLAKIENRQFVEQSHIDLQKMIPGKLKQFAEQLQAKSIQVKSDLTESTLPGNKQLIDVMLNNLLSNAIRYNRENGMVAVHLQSHRFEITNTSELAALNQQNIFKRFYKGNTAVVHHGLGLSIVKEICDASGYSCQYEFHLPNLHSFVITW